MTLAADCCWVISPRYFYHIYNRWGSQTTERGKQSLPLCEDSHFLPCKENNTKERRRATISRIGTRCAGWLFEPGMDGTEVEQAQGRRTEEKAQGMPCAHVNQRRTNYQTNFRTTTKNLSSSGWVCIKVQEGMLFITSEHNRPGLKHRLPQ